MEEGRLSFSLALGPAVEEASAIFIAVGTPPLPDGSADLSFVEEVARSIAEHMNSYKVVVTKSTVPTGTGQRIEEILRRNREGHEFAVVSNPEFLREGSAIEDFLQPDRVVIGSRDPRAVDLMLDIYSPLRVADVPFVITDVESAELIKYASNGFLATKISFINEVATLCEALGADVEDVARGMGLDERIGPKFLHPGPGYGGSCFPKDTRAVSQIARDLGQRFHIVDAVIDVNERVKTRMVDKVVRAMDGVEGKTVGVLGLSFKPDTDDVRESAAIPIVGGLIERGARIRAFDPEAMANSRELLPTDVVYCDSSYEAARGAHALLILTEWNPFRRLEFARLHELLASHHRPAQHLRTPEDGRRRIPLHLRGPARRTARAMTTSVITGGAGFLGSHLCERLLAEGRDLRGQLRDRQISEHRGVSRRRPVPTHRARRLPALVRRRRRGLRAPLRFPGLTHRLCSPSRP